MSNKILSKEEFEEKNYNICEYEHINSRQTSCYKCYGQPNNCLNMKKAYKQYKDSISNNDMLFEMMKVI